MSQICYTKSDMSMLQGIPRRTLKNYLIVVIVVLTIAVFIRFFHQHPEYLRQLGHVNKWWIVAVVALNVPMTVLLVFIYDTCLKLCGKSLGKRENFLLTSWSSIVNFFGPLQSGPGVRAAYLKTRHKVRLRDYTLASLMYYGLFAFFSALFLLVGSRPWWQTLLALAAVAGFSVYVIRWFRRRDKQPSASHFQLRGELLASLMVFTFLQVLLTAVTYWVELKAVNPHVGWGQAMSYAGAANFALFVSLTPDAIGFRETFLVFSKHLHHVSTPNILSANIIDRGSYVIYLLLLFGVVLSLHARDRLHLKQLQESNQ